MNSKEKRSKAANILGVAGTVVFHALVFQTVLLGSRVPHDRIPPVQGAGATDLKSDATASDTLILILMPNVQTDDDLLRDELASAGKALKNPLVTVVSADPLPFVSFDAKSSSEEQPGQDSVESGDPIERAAMFSRYSGQIDARIERAWLRPRSAVGGSNLAAESQVFSCTVRLLQDNRGVIEEAQLLKCNGSAAWQQSLIAAIFSASPLPAPPDPKVFTRSLTMTFEAHPYVPGGTSDEYQTASARMTP